MPEAAGADREDYSPFHRTSNDTVWGKVFDMRDKCYSAIVADFASLKIKALVTKSENGQYPPFVHVEAWKPRDRYSSAETDPRIRGEMVLRLKAMPYHEHTIAATASATIGNRTIGIADRPDFSVRDSVAWALYAVGAERKPSNYTPVSDFFSNAFRSLIPFVPTLHANKIRRAFRNSLPFSLPLLLGAVGLLLGMTGFTTLQSAYYEGEVLAAFGLLLVGIVLVIAALIVRAREKVAVSVTDRPTIPPRYLLMLDSWHAVVPELGSQADALQKQISAKLGGLEAAGITTEVERYGFRTPNGFDERDRIVVSKGQGVAHIHAYRFGDDLFIGWDSYANWARWQETPAISVRRESGGRTEYRGLQSGIYLPNQFDLIDLNSLAELVHRNITNIVKAAMEEHKIDQEIDFTIIRGDRENVLDRAIYDRRSKQEQSGSGQSGGQRRWRIT